MKNPLTFIVDSYMSVLAITIVGAGAALLIIRVANSEAMASAFTRTTVYAPVSVAPAHR